MLDGRVATKLVFADCDGAAVCVAADALDVVPAADGVILAAADTCEVKREGRMGTDADGDDDDVIGWRASCNGEGPSAVEWRGASSALWGTKMCRRVVWQQIEGGPGRAWKDLCSRYLGGQ